MLRSFEMVKCGPFCEFLKSLISRLFLFRYVDLWDEFSKNANERNLNDCDSESNSSGSSA